MLRHCVLAVGLFFLMLGFATAEDVKGKITKIDDKGVTLVVDKNDATGKTYTFAKDCKFSQMVKKTKQDIKDGVKADIFQKLPKKGLAVTLVTAEDGKVTEVIVGKKAKAVN